MVRLVEGEPQVETRFPCLHQQGTSNALIDGSQKPCHLPGDRQEGKREREKVVPPPNKSPLHRQDTHTRLRAPKPRPARNPCLLEISFIKMGAYPTHQSCSGEVAAALSGLLRFNSAAHHSSRGGGANTCHSCLQTFGWIRPEVFTQRTQTV